MSSACTFCLLINPAQAALQASGIPEGPLSEIMQRLLRGGGSEAAQVQRALEAEAQAAERRRVKVGEDVVLDSSLKRGILHCVVPCWHCLCRFGL